MTEAGTLGRVMLIDDERVDQMMYKRILQRSGMVDDVIGFLYAKEALGYLADPSSSKVDLILLDINLPDGSGLELLREVKENTPYIPVILLTANDTDLDIVDGLERGADDYITKPFSTRELISRINAVLRRTKGDKNKAIRVDSLELDPISHRITARETPVEMGPTEYRLLEFFMTHQDRAYSRAQLLDHVWGGNVYVEDRTVDVHIRRLRKALAPHSYDHLVQTVRGTGYRFSSKI